jgi:hypothetical protein
MRYSVARSRPSAPMATVDPKAAAPKPAPPAEPEAIEEQEDAPMVERVNMSGLVLEKTVYPDGECQTEILKEPMIPQEMVRATRALQRRRGH